MDTQLLQYCQINVTIRSFDYEVLGPSRVVGKHLLGLCDYACADLLSLRPKSYLGLSRPIKNNLGVLHFLKKT